MTTEDTDQSEVGVSKDGKARAPIKMPIELRRKFEQFTPFQRLYAEYRAKGLKQSEAAKKAGSQAEDRGALGRVGYNTERMAGIKEYILWMGEQRAKASVIDDIEIVEKLRRVYDEAITAGKFADANKAAELLGNVIGLFRPKQLESGTSLSSKTKNNVNAFKEEDNEDTVEQKQRKLHSLLKDINTLNNKKGI